MQDGTIRELTGADFYRCLSIWDMDGETKSILAEQFYRELLRGSRRVFVYAVDGDLVGEISLVTESEDPDYTLPGQRAYCSHLVVKREYRRRGIGRRLVERLSRAAAELGYTELSVGVDLDNYPAVRLYHEAGFDRLIKVDADAQGPYIKLVKRL